MYTVTLPFTSHFINENVVIQFSEKLENVLKSRSSPSQPQRMNLIVFIESALGLLNFANICQKGNCLANEGAPFVLDGVVFGSDDFVADIGKHIQFF